MDRFIAVLNGIAFYIYYTLAQPWQLYLLGYRFSSAIISWSCIIESMLDSQGFGHPACFDFFTLKNILEVILEGLL